MPEETTLEDLLPAAPPMPPLPRILFRSSPEGSPLPFELGQSPEAPRLPEFPEELRLMTHSLFQSVRGMHSVVQLPTMINRLMEMPTTLFPFGARASEE